MIGIIDKPFHCVKKQFMIFLHLKEIRPALKPLLNFYVMPKFLRRFDFSYNDLHQPPRRDARTKKWAAIRGRMNAFVRRFIVN